MKKSDNLVSIYLVVLQFIYAMVTYYSDLFGIDPGNCPTDIPVDITCNDGMTVMRFTFADRPGNKNICSVIEMAEIFNCYLETHLYKYPALRPYVPAGATDISDMLECLYVDMVWPLNGRYDIDVILVDNDVAYKYVVENRHLFYERNDIMNNNKNDNRVTSSNNNSNNSNLPHILKDFLSTLTKYTKAKYQIYVQNQQAIRLANQQAGLIQFVQQLQYELYTIFVHCTLPSTLHPLACPDDLMLLGIRPYMGGYEVEFLWQKSDTHVGLTVDHVLTQIQKHLNERIKMFRWRVLQNAITDPYIAYRYPLAMHWYTITACTNYQRYPDNYLKITVFFAP